MDDSQSSIFLSNSVDLSCNSSTMIDTASYESLVSNTKISLSTNIQSEIRASTFSTHFTTLIEDCGTCITQSLDFIITLLEDTDVQLTKMCHYMDDSVCLLQMLSNFLKNVIESVSMSCHTMKTFPTTTGNIIMNVFLHCKDSESLYGNHLNSVQKQLKDLFRTCHDLQLTYLMIMEKHFIFDLTEREELDILIEALDINLKIGEIVQNLDVKTMAEQWKAYTMICEKHTNYLLDNSVYNNCIKVLCMMIENNIKNAMEMAHEEKVLLRSLKVASFIIKILLKICTTFRHTTTKNYDCIVKLLVFVYLHCNINLEVTTEKSTQFKNLMSVNVANPTENLLGQLVLDESFLNYTLQYDVDMIEKEDTLLGYILLVVSIIKSILINDDEQVSTEYKNKLLQCVFNFLPYCHVWFNMGLKLNSRKRDDQQETYGLYEHLLAHTVALAATLNSDQYVLLEQNMYEAILKTDCWSALFSSDLWVLLARMSNNQLVVNQIISLCGMYKKIETCKLFKKSPQEVHLCFTLTRLFEVVPNEVKIQVFRHFSLHNDSNFVLWSVLKVWNLPEDMQYNVEEIVSNKLNKSFQNVFTSNIQCTKEIDNLIALLNCAATCSLEDDVLINYVLKAWTKACPMSTDSQEELYKENAWYLEYIAALVNLTNSIKYVIFKRSSDLVKILHVISKIIQTGNVEEKLILINLLCEISLYQIYDGNKQIRFLLIEIFKYLFEDESNTVRNKLFNMIMHYKRDKNVDDAISKIINDDDLLRETWTSIVNLKRLKNFDKIEWKKQLIKTINYKYRHRCIEPKYVTGTDNSGPRKETKKTLNNNFDFANIDTLFGEGSESEQPACKKVKLNINETETIVARLESDTSLLSNMENVFTSEYKNRIKDVCEKLQNMIK